MNDLSHRRHAVQIVSALPECAEDALMVLELAKQLIEGFLAGNQPRPALVLAERGDRERVVSLSSASKGASF
jgi:hypothetical protein